MTGVNFLKLIGYLLLIMALLGLFTSCNEDHPTISPEESFVKIYNTQAFEGNFHAIDIQQTSDGGYLILGAANLWDTYLMKVKATGQFVWDTTITEPYVNPVPNLMNMDEGYYFVCMDDIGLQSYLMRVNLEGGVEEVASYNDLIYPLHASKVNDGFLLQNYDRDSRSTSLAKMDNGFGLEWEKKYPVLEDVEPPIMNHLTRQGERLAFFTGSLNNGQQYYLNGFYNFTFSLLFVSPSNGDITGVVNGFRQKGAINSMVHLENNVFAFSRYTFEENYLLPSTQVNTQEISFGEDFSSDQFPELSPKANVEVLTMDINGQSVVLFATTTKNNQIVLYTFEQETGAPLGIKHLGAHQPYRLASITKTSDEGLAVLGETQVAGRFQRICLFKLPRLEVEGLLEK